jgi:hypothetical protein
VVSEGHLIGENGRHKSPFGSTVDFVKATNSNTSGDANKINYKGRLSSALPICSWSGKSEDSHL